MKEQSLTLFITDDHQIVIDGLQLLLNSELGFRIVGTAIDGDRAHREILSKKPDVALVDLRMPGMSGIELVSSLKKQIETQFIILSMHNDRRYITDAINYGASGYLLKNTGKKELLECIDRVMKGEKYFSAKGISQLKNSVGLFTPREFEIIKLIISENTSQEIAEQLHLSHYTIETHRKNICRKTNTKTALSLTKYLSDNGIELS